MENYLITEDTVALLKQRNKTIIYNVENIKVINKSIKKIIEYNCNFYGSSMIGRKKCAKQILNISYKLPIIIEDNKNLILIPLNSNRKDECLYLVTNKIVDYNVLEDKLQIICCNNNIFHSKISKNCFEKLIINSIKLNNVLNWRKNGNFL